MANDNEERMTTLTAEVGRLGEALGRLDEDGRSAVDDAIRASQDALLTLWGIHTRLLILAGQAPWRDTGTGPGWSPSP